MAFGYIPLSLDQYMCDRRAFGHTYLDPDLLLEPSHKVGAILRESVNKKYGFIEKFLCLYTLLIEIF